jgi:hypothetical protein
MKKYFFPFIITFMIIFNSFVPKIVYANSYVPVIASASMSAGAVAMGTVLAPFVVPVAIVSVACISAGIIFENREELKVVAGGIFQKMQASGIVIGATSLSAEALSFINAQIAIMTTSGTINVNIERIGNITNFGSAYLMNNITVHGGTQVKYYDTRWNIQVGHSLPNDFTIITALSGINNVSISLSNNTGTWIGYAPLSQPATIEYDDNATGSICVDVPSSMTATPSVTAPYAVDTALNIPSDIAWDTPAMDGLIGVRDWSIPFERSVDVPLDTPLDPPMDDTISMPNDNTLKFPALSVVADRFPFCIPFDLINSFKSFSAEKVTPKLDVTFPSIYGSKPTGFKIDFTQFDKIVAILRYFILLIFIVNLIKLTRSLIRG